MEERTRRVSRIVIRGSMEAVWRELTKDDEPRAAIFNAWLHAQSFAPGSALQMRTADGRNVLVIGRVVEFSPPRRFAHTFRFTQYDDPECTVVYELKAVPEGVEVSLIIENLAPGTRTAKDMTSGSRSILATLRSIVESGRPRLKTRIMYWLFGKIGFLLPARTRAERWPL